MQRARRGRAGQGLEYLGGHGHKLSSATSAATVRTVRIVNVLDESTKFAFLLRDRSDYLVDRHFGRKESPDQLSKRLNQGNYKVHPGIIRSSDAIGSHL